MKLALPLLAAIVALAIGAAGFFLRSEPASPLEPEAWRGFADRFVAPDGRVVDVDNGGRTHTEGQGYGLLLAEAAGQREDFARIWSWTETHLRRPDGLFSWSYGPCPSADGDCVLDRNNASDADILIAWALLRAGTHWKNPSYLAAARTIAESVAQKLVIERNGLTLLLPGAEGFLHQDRVVVNLSYWLFPAFAEFEQAFPSPVWKNLSLSGFEITRAARFGAENLPSDWVEIRDSGAIAPAVGFPPRFGFDAVRVPLNLAWSANLDTDLLKPFATYWSRASGGGVPAAWVDVETGEKAPYAWQVGMQCVSQLATGRVDRRRLSPRDLPPVGAGDGYYSTSVTLLCHLAASEVGAKS